MHSGQLIRGAPDEVRDKGAESRSVRAALGSRRELPRRQDGHLVRHQNTLPNAQQKGKKRAEDEVGDLFEKARQHGAEAGTAAAGLAFMLAMRVSAPSFFRGETMRQPLLTSGT